VKTNQPNDDFCNQLLEAFQRLDEETVPQGLYAIREHDAKADLHPEFKIEADKVLLPALRSLGCNPLRVSAKSLKSGSFAFQSTSAVQKATLMRISKIKVRKFGNAYRLDPHQEFSNRWTELNVAGYLRTAARWANRRAQLLILIGFSSEARPLEKELRELDDWKSLATSCQRFQRTWQDSHGRGFKTTVVLWRIAKMT